MTNSKSTIHCGSEWRKWDLHVHSPKTFLGNSYGACGIGDFVQKVTDSGVVAIGLTNYFRFDDGELEEIRRKLNKKGVVVFPNLEFRTQPPNKEGKEMHIHIIFSDKISVSKINGFLGRLKTVDDKYCKDLTTGDIKTTSITFDSLRKQLVEDSEIKRFEDYLLVACPRGAGNFRPLGKDDGRGSKLAVVIDTYTDILFGREKDRDFFLKTDRYDNALQKPVLSCSDAHKKDDVGSRFTWIKAEVTFEGLKQVVYDPESRVFISKKAPLKPPNVIDSISFNIPTDAEITVEQTSGKPKKETFCFAGAHDTFYLSPFFNCFIGGRGTGKSTILNFLGKQSNNPSSSEAFWAKIQPSFSVSDRKLFSFDGIEIFEFIGQSEVESFATDKKAFTNAIYERANIISGNTLEKHEIKLGTLLKQINSFRGVIEEIDVLTDEEKIKGKERKTLESSIEITKSREYVVIAGEITEKSNQKQQLESWRTAVDGLRESIAELQGQCFDSTPEVEKGGEIPLAKKLGREEDVVKIYRDAYENAKGSIESAAATLNEDNFAKLMEVEMSLAGEIETHENELSQLLGEAGLSEENILQVKSAPQKLVGINGELSKIKKKIEGKGAKLDEYKDVLAETETVKEEYETAIEDSIRPLVAILEKQAKENDTQDIRNISLSYFFDEQRAWGEVADEFYTHFRKKYKGIDRSDLLKKYIISNKRAFAKEHNEVNKLLSKEKDTVGYIEFLKETFLTDLNFKIFQAIRDSCLNDVAKYRRIQVLYDSKDIEQASFGQRCAAVMVILLLFGNYPLIIDEPEAHLDSSLIANYLVPLIRKKKSNRQIIFATHNANFVVNGDVEKIFILKNKTGRTEVIEATIEDLVNRDELLKLEGGKEAFRKRGEKLHI